MSEFIKQEITHIARIAHAADAALVAIRTGIAQPDWDELSEAQQQMVRFDVRQALRYPQAVDEQWHYVWRAEMAEAGWTYGAQLQAERKEHPALVEYDQLPTLWRERLYQRHAIVTANAAFLLTETDNF